jgi:predicted transcriptional regulator
MVVKPYSMKLKRAIVVVESTQLTNKRWIKALEGKLTIKSKESVIICSSFKIAEKLFSAPRLNILRAIINQKPESIKQLAKLLGKDFKNVYNDVMFLADLGLIELVEKGSPKAIKLIPKFNELELKLAA